MPTRTVNLSTKEVAEQRYTAARNNLLMMLIFTVINIVLFVSGSNTMFLFSATVPYCAAIYGMVLSEIPIFLIMGMSIAVIVLVAYLLCWIFSKKHYGWMIGALVLFALDLVGLGYMYLTSSGGLDLIDTLFHLWVLYYLISGVYYGVKLSKMPADPPVWTQEAEETEELSGAETETEDSRPLRRADTEVKARILLEADAYGRHIVYRRVKRTNELVIGSYVYDEVEMLIESAHALTANLGGHTFVVGCDGVYSYLEADGALVERKRRLW